MSDDECGSSEGENRPGKRAVRRRSGLDSPTIDAVYDVLRNRRRRYVLYYLGHHDSAELDALVGRIAEWETEKPASRIPTDVIEQLAADLHHVHLPKLAAERFVEYDRRSGAVRYRARSELLEACLCLTSATEAPDATTD